MNVAEVTVEQVLQLAQQLKPSEQAHLIARLAEKMEKSLETIAQSPAVPRQTLWGALADLGPAPSAEDIDEARREMWGNFPREDV